MTKTGMPIRGATAVSRGLILGLALAVLPSVEAVAASAVGLTADPVVAGDAATVGVSLTVDSGVSISAVSVNISFDETVLDPSPGCAIDPSIGPGTTPDKDVQVSVPETGVLRVAVLGFNDQAIPSGPIFDCQFDTDVAGPLGTTMLNGAAEASTPGGATAPVTGGSTDLLITDGSGQSGLCGDVNDDGVVDGSDVDAIRDVLAGVTSGLLAPAQCSVIGGLMDCDMLDVVVLRRHLDSGLPPGLSPVCAGAQP